jgi:hypothetical protein
MRELLRGIVKAPHSLLHLKEVETHRRRFDENGDVAICAAFSVP